MKNGKHARELSCENTAQPNEQVAEKDDNGDKCEGFLLLSNLKEPT